MTNSGKNTRQWDQIWQSGKANCFSDYDGSPNAQLIRDEWSRFFARLDDGQRLLDLCTGNGAVLVVALECARAAGNRISACGIDSASIAPSSEVADAGPGDTWFIRAAVEALPFADASFDAVTSQFGVDYIQPGAAAREALRVLTDGGRGMFISHASGGITVTQAEAELQDIDELQNEIAIFPAAQEAFPKVWAAERASRPLPQADLATAQAAHDRFHQALAKIGETFQQRAAFAVYRDTGDILQHAFLNRQHFPVETLLDKVREVEQSVLLHKARLEALVGAALDESRCREYVEACRQHGAMACDYRPIGAANGDGQLAWAIDFSK
ncbi:MAG: methyltransferase domain-containing protein [Woeseiaceae bacterium]|nr:methyltransferase domain-containing protein [Woeseiaceae bacterium]